MCHASHHRCFVLFKKIFLWQEEFVCECQNRWFNSQKMFVSFKSYKNPSLSSHVCKKKNKLNILFMLHRTSLFFFKKNTAEYFFKTLSILFIYPHPWPTFIVSYYRQYIFINQCTWMKRWCNDEDTETYLKWHEKIMVLIIIIIILCQCKKKRKLYREKHFILSN